MAPAMPDAAWVLASDAEAWETHARACFAASVDGDAGSLRSHGLGEATSDAAACSRDEDNLASQHLLVVGSRVARSTARSFHRAAAGGGGAALLVICCVGYYMYRTSREPKGTTMMMDYSPPAGAPSSSAGPSGFFKIEGHHV